MKSFADLGLAETIVRAVAAEGYTHPTPIQAGVIPAMIAGQDVLGIAQTGSGAFFYPQPLGPGVGPVAIAIIGLIRVVAQQRR